MRPVSNAQLRQAADALLRGGVVAFPTETSYGLGADATNTRAVKRISAIKGREPEKTPPLIVASFAMAERYGVFTPKLRQLARMAWPGPLTVILQAKSRSGLSKNVIREDGTIALRISSHPAARTLSRRTGVPIVATSANKSGEPACFDAESVRKLFTGGNAPDVVLDGGVLRKQLPSTIVKETEEGIVVLRKGPARIPKRYVA